MNNQSRRGYEFVVWTGAILIGVAVFISTVQKKWDIVLLLGITFAPVVALLMAANRLSTTAILPLVLTLLINAAAFVWNLFSKLWWLDEFMHFSTGFALALPLGLLLLSTKSAVFQRRFGMFILLVVSLIFAAGLLWELAEWVCNRLWPGRELIEGKMDTMDDLALDAAGAFLASWFISLFSGPRPTQR